MQKHFRYSGLWLAIPALALLAAAAVAQVPHDMTYTGRLVDSGGSPLTGPVDLELRIFDAEFSGTQLYSEEHLGVVLDATGGFTVQLGMGTSPSGTFDADLFADADRWLEVVVGPEVLTPRQIVGSVPWALVAERSETIGPAKPIWFKKYTYSSNVDGADLEVDYRDYAAAIVGFNTGFYDIDEAGAYNHMNVHLEWNPSTFKWRLWARAEGQGNWPEFTVWVMYIDMNLVGDMTNY